MARKDTVMSKFAKFCTLPKTAKAVLHNFLAELLQQRDIFGDTLAGANALEDFENAACANPAGNALAAGFILGEFHEETGNVNHAGFFVHDDHTARAHN